MSVSDKQQNQLFVVLFQQENCETYTASFIGVYTTEQNAFDGIELFIARLQERCIKDVYKHQSTLLSELFDDPSNKAIENRVNELQTIIDQLNTGDLSYLAERYGFDHENFREKFEIIRTSLDATDDWESSFPYDLSESSDDDDQDDSKMDE